MNASKIAIRSSRALRTSRVRLTEQRRFQSSSTNSHSSTALYGGLAGGAFAFLLGYTWYSFSGVKTAVSAAHQAKSYFDTSKQKLKEAAPEPNEALEWLRKQTSFYAGFVPGGKQYVDSAFQDLDSVRQKHGKEVDNIVKEAYEELKQVASKDLSVGTATEAWQILQKHIKKIGELAGDSAKEIFDNHPQLQSLIGDNVKQLRSVAKSVGSDADDIVSDTWNQVRNVISGGIGAGTAVKLKQIIEEKIQKLKEMGDQAWSKGAEELKPYLDKNPEVKKLLESNKKELLSGNVSELWKKAKEVSQSGDSKGLEEYVKSTVDKAKSSGLDIEKYFEGVLPGGASQLIPKFAEWKEIVQKDGKKLEDLIKETVKEIEQILQKQLDKGKKLVDEKKKGE